MTKKNIYGLIIFCSLPVFFLMYYTKISSSHKNVLINSIENNFYGKQALLYQFTDFEWDKICVFQNDSSERNATYLDYRAYAESIDVDYTILVPKNYNLILSFFRNKNLVKAYGFKNQKLNWKNDIYLILSRDLYPFSDQTYFCGNNKSIFLDIKADVMYIYQLGL